MEEGCKNSCTEDTSPEILLTEIYPGDSENLESVEIIHSENLQEPDQSQLQVTDANVNCLNSVEIIQVPEDQDSIYAETNAPENNNTIEKLRKLKLKYWNRLIIGSLNINSIRNKFDMLSDIMNNKLDILIVLETKLDSSFPDAQFKITGFTGPYRLDRDCNGGGVMIYVTERISSRELRKHNFEGIELNLRSHKILLFGGYRSDHETFGISKEDFLHHLSLGLDS